MPGFPFSAKASRAFLIRAGSGPGFYGFEPYCIVDIGLEPSDGIASILPYPSPTSLHLLRAFTIEPQEVLTKAR